MKSEREGEKENDEYPDNITYVQITWNGFSWCIRESVVDDVMDEYDCSNFIICSNIFDNPELLNGE